MTFSNSDETRQQLLNIYEIAQNPEIKLSLPVVLAFAKVELEHRSPQPQNLPQSPWYDFEYYESFMLQARLTQFEPFSELEAKLLRFPGGSATSGQGDTLRWVARQLLRGLPIDEIITTANSQFSANGFEALEVSKVVGLEVSEKTELIAGFELWPYEMLPADYRRRIAFELDSPTRVNRGGTALVHRFWYSPVISDVNIFEEGFDFTKDPLLQSMQLRTENRLKLRRALLLSVGCAVELPITYCCCETDHLLASDRGYQFSVEPHTTISVPPDVERIRQNFKLLEEFKRPDAISVAVDRLGKARVSFSNVDKALDFGMALEIALMHEVGSNSEANNEITYKIASRAAWLLGKEPEKRGEVYQLAKQLYGQRSSAVHSGRLKKEASFSPPVSDAFVRDVLVEILHRGEFPHWANLVLGLA